MSQLVVGLRRLYGEDFPVGAGSLKRDDPLLLHAHKDYVAVEYRIAKYIFEKTQLEYKFEEQFVRQIDGRVIDELVYATKPLGAPEWTHTRRLFFDVTSNFSIL